MSRAAIALIAITALIALTACYSAPIKPPVGYLFSDISAPVSTMGNGETLGTRVGHAESQSILGLFATGDCSVAAAARNGGITEVQHIDYKFYNMLGIVQRFTTVVIGE